MDWSEVPPPSERDGAAGWKLLVKANKPGGHVVDLSRSDLTDAVRGRCWRLLIVLSRELELVDLTAEPLPGESQQQLILRATNGTARFRVELTDKGREAVRTGRVQEALDRIARDYSRFER